MSPNSDSHDSNQTAESGGDLKIIDLEFETLRRFREEMAPRLNYEGFFVPTEDPLPRGTPATFRFLLAGGFVLVEGTAVVAGVRLKAQGPDRRPGMALLFNDFQHQSREIINELIDFNVSTGGEPFDFESMVSETGEIGSYGLAGDSVETEPPASDPVTLPEPDEPEDTTPEEVLPDWLTEVARRNDLGPMGDSTVPFREGREDLERPEFHEPGQQNFEISLMPEEEGSDPTPAYPDVGEAPEVTMTPSDGREGPRDFRLIPVIVITVVLVAAAATVWWMANRRTVTALPEPIVVVDEVPVSEPPVEVGEEKLAETSGDPVDVSEPVPASPQLQEVAGPATRVLLVVATRTGDGTVVTIRANGELFRESVRVSLLKDPARVWVRIQGIEATYRPNDIEVGTSEVERVRVGHHPEETPQSLYVVFDLKNPAAVVREQTVEGDTLRVVVGRP